MYYAALTTISLSLSTQESTGRIQGYKSLLELSISADDIRKITRAAEIVNPTSKFMNWIVGGVGHYLAVAFGIWLYSQVGTPADTALQISAFSGGGIVGLTHEASGKLVWKPIADCINRIHGKYKTMMIDDKITDIDTYLCGIYEIWRDAVCQGAGTFDPEIGVDISCGLGPDFKGKLDELSKIAPQASPGSI